MAAVEIDLKIKDQQSTYFNIQPRLSGQVYNFTLRWSQRTQSWYLKINETISGIKLVNGIDILEPYHYIDSLPPGKLGCVRNSGTSSKPGFDNFGIGEEVTFRYEEP